MDARTGSALDARARVAPSIATRTSYEVRIAQLEASLEAANAAQASTGWRVAAESLQGVVRSLTMVLGCTEGTLLTAASALRAEVVQLRRDNREMAMLLAREGSR